ncbi:Tetratricopeptide repeat protein 4 [Armadillidium vulgare]|nr:Tetratricopeptide repeat protein 4 [Armadillidium vulgare]
MAEHPLFTPYLQPDKKEVEAPINELSEGLAQLKYDSEHSSPVEIAQNYKEEGIFYFKSKKYQNAVNSFTEAIKVKCSNNDLNAQLYNNRSAAHFYLENYRTSLMDSCKAIEMKPRYIKAFNRAVLCAAKLKDWNKMIELCNEVLLLEPSNEHFRKHFATATAEKKKFAVEKRKSAAAERKRLRLEENLLLEIRNRGIKIIPSLNVDENEKPSLIHELQPQIQSFGNAMVHLNGNELIWPVLFLYPEHDQTDSILEFNENTRFRDHFETMFGYDGPPIPWDIESKYKPENLSVYHQISSSRHLVCVNPLSTLRDFSCTKK